MSFYVLDLAPVRRRLQDEVAALKLVGGAAELDRASQALPAVPAAFVLPTAERADPSPYANQVTEQRVGARFSIIYAVQNLAGIDDAAAFTSLRPVRLAAGDALLGWAPASECDNCEFVGGQLMTIDANNVLWWQDEFVTAYTIRSA